MDTLGIKITEGDKRNSICSQIHKRLFDLEKYSTSKQKNKFTYLIVPSNHPTIPFPLNLEDRQKHVLTGIQKKTRTAVNCKININKLPKGNFSDIKYVSYDLVFDHTMDKFADILEYYHAKKIDNTWVINIT